MDACQNTPLLSFPGVTRASCLLKCENARHGDYNEGTNEGEGAATAVLGCRNRPKMPTLTNTHAPRRDALLTTCSPECRLTEWDQSGRLWNRK